LQRLQIKGCRALDAPFRRIDRNGPRREAAVDDVDGDLAGKRQLTGAEAGTQRLLQRGVEAVGVAAQRRFDRLADSARP